MSNRATLKEVAAHAGVSYQTVSRVINNSPEVAPGTRARVRASIQALNYTPRTTARLLSRRRPSVIGVVTPVVPAVLFSDIHLLQIIGGIAQEVTSRHGSLLLLAPQAGGEPLSVCDRLVKERLADGAIVEGRLGEAGIRLLVDEGYPVVVVGYTDYGVPCIHPDDEGGAYGLAQHLLALGHRRIAAISGPNCPTMGARWRGFTRAFRDIGLDHDPDLAIVRSDSTAQAGYQAVAQLMQQTVPPTAVLAFCGCLAVGALRWLLENGYVIPNQVSIACIDDIPHVELFGVPLTTVRLFSADLGRQATAVLFDLIDGNTPIRAETTLPSRLVARCSTALALTPEHPSLGGGRTF